MLDHGLSEENRDDSHREFENQGVMPQTVDLTNCDREPIHIPGLIQPHGILFILQNPTLEIVQVSDNTLEIIGRQPQDLVGEPLAALLSARQIKQIKQCLSEDFEGINPLSISVKHQNKPLYFDGIVHRLDTAIVLELERKKAKRKADLFNFYQLIKGTVPRLQAAPTLLEMCQVVVEEVQQITGFERVMVYRFDEAGAGSVIAEATDQAPPYLGLHYPPSDIPKQARQLYTLNWLRLIPDAKYQPVRLIPTNNPLTNQPLDLSLSALRSVSPIHLEYLQNMGVTASMSISLIQNQQLWGLIACHHSSPKYVPYNIRTACEFIGRVMSVELANKEASEDLNYKMKLKSLQTQFVEALSQAEYFLDGIEHLETELLQLANASGAVICSGKQCIQMGETPSSEDIRGLLDWIKPQFQHNLFQTRSLCKEYPAAESFKAIASGVLALEISPVQGNYMLWFRPEVIQTVNWGGNPNKPVEVSEDGGLRMSPRKSFELWRETVRGCSLPWEPSEIEVIAELRSLIVGIVLQQADELASTNLELQRSNEELDSFAYAASHDLKEPLRGIHNYANFLMEDYGEILDDEGISQLQNMVRLTQRMEGLLDSLLHLSRLGRTELVRCPVNLDKLVEQVIDTLTIARPQSNIKFRIPQTLPNFDCDRTQINELFTNLISNAMKYNNKSEKWIEIGVIDGCGEGEIGMEKQASLPPSLHPLTFYVRDNGIGIRQEHLDKIFQIFRRLHGRNEFGGGTGAGLTIARKIVERHGGKIWVESTPDQGSAFYFTLSTGEDV